MSIDWSVTLESFTYKGNLLRCWGKLQGNGAIPCSVWLKHGSEFTNERQGLRAALTDNIHSTHNKKQSVDFVLYGIAPDLLNSTTSLCLVLEWPDGRQQLLKMPPPRQTSGKRGLCCLAGLPWGHYFSRGFRLVRQKQVGLLARKITGMAGAMLKSGWHPEQLLKWASSEGKPLALVIDHDLGGGANQYRRIHMANLETEGYVPVLLTTHNGLLSYVLTVKRGRRNYTSHVEELDVLFAQLAEGEFRRIVFNNILSYPDPITFISKLIQWLQQVPPEKFLFLVHDHYCVCPIWLLLDHTGKYCGIPNMGNCADCLHNNTAQFLELVAGANIGTWRAAWGALLAHAHEVRCFSEATRKLVLRAQPGLLPSRITVVPHRVEHVALRPIALHDSGWPVIGILGHLTFSKGSEVVKALAEYIQVTGSAARIVVVGTIDSLVPLPVVTVTGPYLPGQLPDLLENHGVNIGLFPSIWPETFSYVAEEMMLMGLPLVTFDIGAPGERVARYPRGQVIPLSSDPNSILTAIESLYHTHNSQPRPQVLTP